MTPLYRDILSQPATLEHVADHQFGPGRSELIEASGWLRRAQDIVFSGMGSSLFACIPLRCYLSSHGIAATAIETSELLHFHRKILKPDSVLVLVSRSGETVEATRLLDLARDGHVPVIGVTNEGDSTLARNATRTLLVNSARDQLVAVQTYTATLATLLCLGAAVCGEFDGQLRDTFAHVPAALANCLDACAAASRNWRELLETPSPVYLLGRGASLASIFEGALLFHEVAKTPAVAMDAGNFRHGPCEAVSAAFRSVIFGSQVATFDLDAGLARDILHLGGQAAWIGLPAAGLHSAALCGWPADIPEVFAPLVEIAPIQIATYRLAEWRGITPGDFYITGQVTLSETGFERR
ncbi:MAG TPA: SIS domain-containing protein [Bryobacteraceae bacterium]|nr:SIS domain-containing protein [Bryobacteraceae bacterium]